MTPDDLLKAARLFSQLNSNLELREDQRTGMKIVQLRVGNAEVDFQKYCSEPIRKSKHGLSVEDLVKQFKLSILVAKDKLDRYAQEGRLVIDSSLEGRRYYLNDIVTCTFE